MSVRSALARLAIVTAAGTLAATAAVTPALADDWDGDGGGSTSQNDGSQNWGDQGGGQDDPGGGQNGQGDNQGNGQGSGQGNSQGSGQGNGQGNSQGSGQGSGQWNQGNQSGQNGDWQSGGGDGGDWQSGGGGGDWQSGHQNDSRRYRGRVTANELLLRSAPTRASQVIRVAHRGEIVSIFCRTPGQNVQGNSVWYLLTDGTWAWGSARYIDTIGATPRWC